MKLQGSFRMMLKQYSPRWDQKRSTVSDSEKDGHSLELKDKRMATRREENSMKWDLS